MIDNWIKGWKEGGIESEFVDWSDFQNIDISKKNKNKRKFISLIWDLDPWQNRKQEKQLFVSYEIKRT